MTTEQITGEQDGNPLFEAFDSWLWSACTCATEVGWTCGAHKNAQPLLLALQDILGIPDEGLPEGGKYQYEYQQAEDRGYNLALSKVRQAIKNRLGE